MRASPGAMAARMAATSSASNTRGSTKQPSRSNAAACSGVIVVHGPRWSSHVKAVFHGWRSRATGMAAP